MQRTTDSSKPFPRTISQPGEPRLSRAKVGVSVSPSSPAWPPASPAMHWAVQAGDAAAAPQDLLLQLHLQVLTQAVPALSRSPERGSPTRLQCSCWACTVCCCLSPSIGFLPLVVTLLLAAPLSASPRGVFSCFASKLFEPVCKILLILLQIFP